MSKFYNLCPKNFQYSKKKTDMCDICIHGKKLIKNQKNEKGNECERIQYYKNHLELNKEQNKNFKINLNHLNENECCIIMDFKENFKIRGGAIKSSQTLINSKYRVLGFVLFKRRTILRENIIIIFQKQSLMIHILKLNH